MMSIFSRILHSIFLSIFCFLLVACAAPKIKQNVTMPANSHGMTNANKIAVLDFYGDWDKSFSTKIESFFTNIRVNNKPYFIVLNHASLNSSSQHPANQAAENQHERIQTIDNPSLSGPNTGLIISFKDPKTILSALLSGSIDSPIVPTSASSPSTTRNASYQASNFDITNKIELAKQAGVDTVITGVIKQPKIQDIPYQEERSKCVQHAKEESKSIIPGVKYKKCLKYTKFKVACYRQQSNFKFTLKALNVQNSSITFAKDYSGSTENKYCEDSKSSKKTDESLSTLAVSQAINTMRRDVAPYNVVVSIELMDDDDSKLSDNKSAKMLFETGLDLASDGSLSQACENFKLAADSFKQSPALYHNLGVCEETKNHLEAASNLYRQANELTVKTDKTITGALNRIQDRKIKSQQLGEQMH